MIPLRRKKSIRIEEIGEDPYTTWRNSWRRGECMLDSTGSSRSSPLLACSSASRSPMAFSSASQTPPLICSSRSSFIGNAEMSTLYSELVITNMNLELKCELAAYATKEEQEKVAALESELSDMAEKNALLICEFDEKKSDCENLSGTITDMSNHMKKLEDRAEHAENLFAKLEIEQKAKMMNKLNIDNYTRQTDPKILKLASKVAVMREDREIFHEQIKSVEYREKNESTQLQTIYEKEKMTASKSVYFRIKELEGKINKDRIQTDVVKLQRDKLVKEVIELKSSNTRLETWNEGMKTQFESLLELGDNLAATNSFLEKENKEGKIRYEESSTTILLMDDRIREFMLHVENLEFQLTSVDIEHEALLVSKLECDHRITDFKMQSDVMDNELTAIREECDSLRACNILIQYEKKHSEKLLSDLDRSLSQKSTSSKSIPIEQKSLSVQSLTGFFNL